MDVTDVVGDSAGHVLANLGCHVVKLVPEQGSASWSYSLGEGRPSSGPSYYFQAFNSAKELKTIPSSTPHSDADIRLALRSADLVIVSDNWELGRTVEATAQRESFDGPIVRIDCGGVPRPDDLAYSEFLAQAQGGLAYVTGGQPGTPAFVKAPVAAVLVGFWAAAASVSLLLWPAPRCESRKASVSLFEAIAGANHHLALAWMADNRIVGRSGDRVSVGRGLSRRTFWRCLDGEVQFSWYVGPGWGTKTERLASYIGSHFRRSLLQQVPWETKSTMLLSQMEVDEWEPEFAAFFESRTGAELQVIADELHIPLSPVNHPRDLLNYAQLKSRGAVKEGVGIDLTAPIARLVTGQHGPLAGRPARRGDGQSAPLEGVRVLDLTWAVAGPCATKQLALLGAEVLKVESRRRPDSARMSGPFAGQRAGINNSLTFGDFNDGKKSIALDFSQPGGRAALLRLVGESDVVVENFTPGTLARRGLSFETLRKQNPNLVLVSLSMQGQDGPSAASPGLGNTLQSLSGLDALSTAAPPRGPKQFLPDFLTVPVTVSALLIALAHARSRSGGYHLDLSQLEIVLRVVGPALLAEGDPTRRASQPSEVPLLFPCSPGEAGEDRWVVAIQGQRQSPQVPPESFASERDPANLLAELLEAGLVGTTVSTGRDLATSPSLLATHFADVNGYSPMGLAKPLVRMPPWHLAGHDWCVQGAPRIGEHTLQILLDVAAMQPNDVWQLIASGAAEAE